MRFKGDQQKAKAPYLGIEPLHSEDIADAIAYVASRCVGSQLHRYCPAGPDSTRMGRPDHVQIAEMTILATHQASAEFIHREPVGK